jgi:surfactin synthase thioesterase subunit
MHEWIAKKSRVANHDATSNLPAPAVPALYCFHHAGGSAASYNSWHLNWPTVSCLRLVELPGRPGALHPLSFANVDELLPALLQGFLAQLDKVEQYAFYGHSLGALVAYRLTRALIEQGHTAPAFLAISGRRSPTCPLPTAALWNLPEDALIESLHSLGGMPESLLASIKWRRLFLPSMRADLRLSDEYLEAPQVPLPLPVIALRGHTDPIVSPRELENWCAVAGHGFQHESVPGAHFFTQEGTRLLQYKLQNAMADIVNFALHRPGEVVCSS